MDSKSTRGSGWQHIRTSEDETYVMIFDVYILYENSGRKSTGSDWKAERNQDWKARLKNFSVSKAALNNGLCIALEAARWLPQQEMMYLF